MLIIRGDYIWTGEELLRDSALVCQDDRIERCGPWSQIREAYPTAPVVGGPGIAVLPGLINAHHHGSGISSFMRGVHDDALEPWLAALGTAPGVDPYLDTLWAALGLLQGGYTTVVLFQSTSNPEEAGQEARTRIQACRDAGLRVAFGLDLIQQNFYVYGPDPKDRPPRTGLATKEYLDLLETLEDEFAADPCISVFAAPSGPQWVSDEAWEAIGEWTKSRRIPLHTHCLESPYESAYAQKAYNESAVAYIDRLGALHRHTSLVHGVYLSEEDLDLMKQRDASLITNPGSNLRLRCGVSPVLFAKARGVPVALGTDSCSLGERDDAFAEMRLLLYLQRGPGVRTPSLTCEDVLEASTHAAASVTSWGDNLGVIKPGAYADFSLYDYREAASPWTHPDHDPLHVLVQRAWAHHVSAIVVGGRLVWENTRGPLNVDVHEVALQIQDSLHGTTEGPDAAWIERVRAYYWDWPVPKRLSRLTE